jgi:hypothetical protein
MRQPSADFIGAMTGLLLIAPLLPHSKTEEEFLFCLIAFPGLGAIMGTVVGIVLHRRR